MKAVFDFEKMLREGCQAIGLADLDDDAVNRLYDYYKELRHWNKRMNLVAKKATEKEILEKHFLDSLTLLPLLDDGNTHLLDIGTGAGFPGLVCKAAKPSLQLTLVEPRKKRVAFLSHITRTLGLTDISILDCRVEDEVMLPSDGGFSHITSRAVSEIKVFLEMSKRFMQPGVQVICMKGPKWKEELTAWEQSSGAALFQCVSRTEYKLPELDGTRHLLVFEQSSKNN